jgi:hypothetical protein
MVKLHEVYAAAYMWLYMRKSRDFHFAAMNTQVDSDIYHLSVKHHDILQTEFVDKMRVYITEKNISGFIESDWDYPQFDISKGIEELKNTLKLLIFAQAKLYIPVYRTPVKPDTTKYVPRSMLPASTSVDVSPLNKAVKAYNGSQGDIAVLENYCHCVVEMCSHGPDMSAQSIDDVHFIINAYKSLPRCVELDEVDKALSDIANSLN